MAEHRWYVDERTLGIVLSMILPQLNTRAICFAILVAIQTFTSCSAQGVQTFLEE